MLMFLNAEVQHVFGVTYKNSAETWKKSFEMGDLVDTEGAVAVNTAFPPSLTSRPPNVGRVRPGSAVTHLLLQHLLWAPALLEVLLVRPGPATLLHGFGHPNTLLAGAASPGEGGGRAGHGEAVLLIGGVRLLSGGSQVPLPSQREQIPLRTDGWGGGGVSGAAQLPN